MESVQLLQAELRKLEQTRENYTKVYQTGKCWAVIFAWQQHLLRGSQQRKAKTDVVQNMTDTSALWIKDWAQKLLPGSGLEAMDVSMHVENRGDNHPEKCVPKIPIISKWLPSRKNTDIVQLYFLLFYLFKGILWQKWHQFTY